ncbi:MAG: RNA-directed DNA polymerase, partial [Bdellovibrionales bacterium]|nr:RNA-directed DNA polymerase [Bdellovibrionales bacterium]
VGGPASRILAELLLNKTDKLLASNGFKFCRFVDDYHIFVNSIEEAYKALIFISEKLSKNEGLTLQKNKTRIMPAEEFKTNSEFYIKGSEQIQDQKRAFLQLHLRYDPYSPTAEEDYERLKEQLSNFDVLGLLKNELQKTNIHTSTLKRILKAIEFLDQEPRGAAMITLLENLDKLFPVFSLVMIIISKVFDELTHIHQEDLLQRVRCLIKENDYHAQIDLNLHFIVRVLSKKNDDENEECLVQIYRNTQNEAIKRDIILTMSMWGHSHWVSDIKNNYINLSPWEKRAFVIASYSLFDEGKHWREHTKGHFSPIELFYRDWAADRVQRKGGLGGII